MATVSLESVAPTVASTAAANCGSMEEEEEEKEDEEDAGRFTSCFSELDGDEDIDDAEEEEAEDEET